MVAATVLKNGEKTLHLQNQLTDLMKFGMLMCLNPLDPVSP